MKTKAFEGSGDYWDVTEVFRVAREETPSYTDFEGFAQTDDLVSRAEAATANYTFRFEEYHANGNKFREFIRDTLVHLMFENRDQGDYEMTDDELRGATEALEYILENPRLMCVDQGGRE